jgi:hypothetical protein
MKENSKTLKSVNEIKKLAKENGVENNPLFLTTLDRYETQLEVLSSLKLKITEAVAENKTLVTKEYVKGRENYYTHPAISEFNKTTDSANKTVATLMKIIKAFNDGDDSGTDPLGDIINGGIDNE